MWLCGIKQLREQVTMIEMEIPQDKPKANRKQRRIIMAQAKKSITDAHMIYGKLRGSREFRAMDINAGLPVNNII
jgi:hypothetical protein